MVLAEPSCRLPLLLGPVGADDDPLPKVVFEHTTTENALVVLENAIRNHGKPASIMTDHGSQFYANASEIKKKWVSEFEKRLVSLGIRQILAGSGIRRPTASWRGCTGSCSVSCPSSRR